MKNLITCKVPALDKFVVRATVPIAKGVVYNQEQSEFTILDQNGQPLPTLWAQVARYPNGNASVVKLAAVVTRGDLVPGTLQDFEVVKEPSKTEAPDIDKDIYNMMTTDGNVTLRAYDAYDNVYEETLSISLTSFKKRSVSVYEAGAAYATMSAGGVLKPKVAGDETTLPHLGGLSLWTTGRADDNRVVEIAFDLHNALSESIISDVYFKSLEIAVPKGWEIASVLPEPMMGKSYDESNSDGDDKTVFVLVEPREDGKLHTLPQRYERIWRLVMHETGNADTAAQIAGQNGWGVSNQWKAFPNYYNQFGPLPNIDQQDALQEISGRYDYYSNQLAQNLSWNNQPQDLGMFNPAGVAYGGESGGFEIHQWDGVVAAASKDPVGLLYHMLLHRRYMDRSKFALYEYSGKPINMDDYLNENGTLPWKIFSGQFQKKTWPLNQEDNDAPWEFDEADTTYVDIVKNEGAAPPYEGQLLNYMPIDHQHEARANKDMKALIWLDNDPIARNTLAMRAEVDRMCYYEGPGGRWENTLEYAETHEGKGGSWDRGQAWVTDTISAHYCISSDSERQRYYPWLEATREIVSLLQMPNGFINRDFVSKEVNSSVWNGKYSVTQPYQQNFILHAIRGVEKAVYGTNEPQKAKQLENVILEGCIGTYTFGWMWDPATKQVSGPGTWYSCAVGDLDPDSTPWKTFLEWPPEQLNSYLSNFHLGNTLGYALDILKDSPFGTAAALHVIGIFVGGQDPLEGTKAKGFKNINSEAMLLSLLQD